MSEQVIDLRSTWAVVRRRVGVLVAAAALGATSGAAVAYVHPADFTSSSLVLLPAAPAGSTTSVTHSIDTQVEIAQSEVVLDVARKAVNPVLGMAEVSRRVTVEATTDDVLRFTATGTTSERAEALAQALAQAEVGYLKASTDATGKDARDALAARSQALKASLDSVNAQVAATEQRIAREGLASSTGKADATAVSNLTAQQGKLALQLDQVNKEIDAATNGQPGGAASVIQPATPARTTPQVVHYGTYELGGAAFLVLLAVIVIAWRGRREPTVRSRDEIADAVGIPVAASLQSQAPRSVAGWSTLLQRYAPPNVETWTLRQLLRLVTPGHAGSLLPAPEGDQAPTGVIVLTLSDDMRGLAAGPQIAAFAASTGLRTHLVTAQSHPSANALWAACAGVAAGTQPRPGLFVDTGEPALQAGDDLVVRVVVVDRENPVLHLREAGPCVTLLAVTSGAATSNELATVALAADDSGHPIARIVVLDPDVLDRTTGRLAPAERAQHVPLPSLMTGTPVPGEAASLQSRRRRL